MKKNIFYTLLITVLIFSFLSCNQSDIGIFYGIEKEEKIVDNSLSNKLTIGAMDKLGTTLFIATGRVYKKESGAIDWSKCSTPSGYDLCTSLTVLGTDIYAVWFDMDDADNAIFKTADGSSWTQVTDTDFTGNFSIIKSANAYMVVSTVTGTNEGKYYVTSTGNNDDFDVIQYSAADLNALGGHFDIDYDGTNYFFLTKENIYLENGADFTSLDSVSLAKIDNDEYFGYIYAHDGTNLYANSTFGRFHYSSDGGNNWTEEIEDIYPEANDMISYTVNATPTFFAGTDRAGYYEPESPGLSINSLDDPESDSITCDYQTYKASELQESAVLGFFADTAADELYALTYGKGLWKNIADGSSRKWQRE